MTTEEKLEKIKKLADAMYYAAQQLTTDASRLHKAMDEYHKFIIYECKEEPVSEDFETALEKKVREAQDWIYIEEEGGECPLNEEFGADDLEEFARWGAEWQKEQMVDKVCEWLSNNYSAYDSNSHYEKELFIDVFKKAMKL